MGAAIGQGATQLAATTLGGVFGGPLGAKVGSVLGTALGQGLFPDDVPTMEERVVYPESSPLSSLTTTPIGRSKKTRYMKTPESSPADSLMSLLGPMGSSAIAGLMNPGYKGVFGNKAVVPEAQEGMYTDPNAPDHEEGGMNIEVEGGELILNEEQLAYINGASSEQERGRRFLEVQQMHMQNPVGGGMAWDGAYVRTPKSPAAAGFANSGAFPFVGSTGRRPGPYANPYEQIDLSGISKPEQEFLSLDNQPEFAHLSQPFMKPGDRAGATMPKHSEAGYQSFDLSKISKPETALNEGPPRSQAPAYESPIEQAMRYGKLSGLLGNISDGAKGLVHLGSLLSGAPKASPDFVFEPTQAPYFKDTSTEDMADLAALRTESRAGQKELPHELRIGHEANLSGQAMLGQRDISKRATENRNMNVAADAERRTADTTRRLEVALANYQKRMQENQMAHLSKQTALSGLFQAGDAMITRTGQMGTNDALLRYIDEHTQGMTSKEKMQFMVDFQQGMSRGNFS